MHFDRNSKRSHSIQRHEKLFVEPRLHFGCDVERCLCLENPGRQGFRQLFCVAILLPRPFSRAPHSPLCCDEASRMRLCLGAGRSSNLHSIRVGAISFRPQPFPTISRPRRAYASAVSAAELQFGQVLHETHPHLLKAGERTICLLPDKRLANGEISHSRHHCPRVCSAPLKTCCKPSE